MALQRWSLYEGRETKCLDQVGGPSDWTEDMQRQCKCIAKALQRHSKGKAKALQRQCKRNAKVMQIGLAHALNRYCLLGETAVSEQKLCAFFSPEESGTQNKRETAI